MIALIQRVTEARVDVGNETVGAIGPGLLALVAVQPQDDEPRIQRMADRLLGYRVFPDADGKMNLSLSQAGGELLLVSQFTLAADTRKGMRPSFTAAADPALGRRLFERLEAVLRERGARLATGRFGAHMRVSLVNDGPVTFWLET
jgi:D-tyrosyl-tRNA(Tyr) deacylase